MKTKLTDAEILQSILKELRYQAAVFSKKLEYSSSSSIYHILNGQNNISKKMADNIVKHFPEVNYLYITKGELPILLDKSKEIGQSNFFNNDIQMHDLLKIVKGIEDKLAFIVEKMK